MACTSSRHSVDTTDMIFRSFLGDRNKEYNPDTVLTPSPTELPPIAGVDQMTAFGPHGDAKLFGMAVLLLPQHGPPVPCLSIEAPTSVKPFHRSPPRLTGLGFPSDPLSYTTTTDHGWTDAVGCIRTTWSLLPSTHRLRLEGEYCDSCELHPRPADRSLRST